MGCRKLSGRQNVKFNVQIYYLTNQIVVGSGQVFGVSQVFLKNFYRAMHYCPKGGINCESMSSVRLSVCDVDGSRSHRLEILETN